MINEREAHFTEETLADKVYFPDVLIVRRKKENDDTTTNNL